MQGEFVQHPQLIMPLVRFADQWDVDQVTNAIHLALRESGLGAANMYPVVVETFSELALNVVQHAESSIGGYGFVQFFRFAEAPRFVCGVADGGIGIHNSLAKNPALRARMTSDAQAIALAVQERVSSTGDKSRGIGLSEICQYMRGPGRHLILHSEAGLLEIRDAVDRGVRAAPLFPGTMAYASIAT